MQGSQRSLTHHSVMRCYKALSSTDRPASATPEVTCSFPHGRLRPAGSVELAGWPGYAFWTMVTQRSPPVAFGVAYLNLAWFVRECGWLELGVETVSGDCTSFIRALDAGGMIREGKPTYPSIDEALQDAEQGVSAFRQENGL
jgi:hypothetical protein